MCKICSEWQLGKLTTEEALRNLAELIDPENDSDDQVHYTAIEGYITEKEFYEES